MVDNNATNDTLRTLGLTQNELAVYSGFLKSGETSAAALARSLKMDKSSAYRAVESLEKMGLLIKNFKLRGSTYQAASPDIFTELYSSRRTTLNTIVSDLKLQGESSRRSTYITVEKGLSALQYRMTESLESKEKLIREKFNDRFRFFDNPQHAKFVITYAKKRATKQIKILQLEEDNWQIDRRLEDVMVDTRKYLKEIRRLPPDTKLRENSLRIWDNTINILSEDDQGEFIIITIKDKFVVTLMKDMYDFMWNRCPPV
jgi:predicted DNA-binding transcriptional regulator